MPSCGGGGACGSNCSRSGGGGDDETRNLLPEPETRSGADDDGQSRPRRLCFKCGETEEAHNSMCPPCFRASVFGKFKLAVTTNAMIAPTDNVLVAFSGGPASRVALQFIHEMQYKALKNWDASKSQALPVFGVGVAFIDESILSPKPFHEVEKVIEDIKLIVSDLTPAHKELHIAPIERIYSLDLMDGRSKLKELLHSIADATGREDFLQYLRMLSLQKIALDNKYNKLVLGSCTSGIARHVLSSTVKGQGYSLPADLQYVDSRWEVPVVLPLRDCLAQELSMLCDLDGLKLQQVLDRPCAGINGLVSSFVTLLQDENPSRERTIVRTAEKLKPFSFNKFLENGYHDFLPSRLRPKFQNVISDQTNLSEVLCPICGSPLSESELPSSKKTCETSQTSLEMFVAHCCQSCCFQILPRETASLEQFFSLLPGSMMDRMKNDMSANLSRLREQIEDCLLSDDEEGT